MSDESSHVASVAASRVPKVHKLGCSLLERLAFSSVLSGRIERKKTLK